jgi:hypothetical protein
VRRKVAVVDVISGSNERPAAQSRSGDGGRTIPTKLAPTSLPSRHTTRHVRERRRIIRRTLACVDLSLQGEQPDPIQMSSGSIGADGFSVASLAVPAILASVFFGLNGRDSG